MAMFRNVILPVPAAYIAETTEMTDYERKFYMIERHLIPDHLVYGYGVYGGVYIYDADHIGFQAGTSCD